MATSSQQLNAPEAQPARPTPRANIHHINSIVVPASDPKLAAASDGSKHRSVSLSDSIHWSRFNRQDNHHHGLSTSQDSFLNQYHGQFEKAPAHCSALQTTKQVQHHQQIAYQTLNGYTFCSVCEKRDCVCDCNRLQDVPSNTNWPSQDSKMELITLNKQQYSSSPSTGSNPQLQHFKYSSGRDQQYGYVNQQHSSSSQPDQPIMISVASGDFPTTNSYNYGQNSSTNNTSSNHDMANQDNWMLFDQSATVASEPYEISDFASNSRSNNVSQVGHLEPAKTISQDLNNNNSHPYEQANLTPYKDYQQQAAHDQQFELNDYYQQVTCQESSNYTQKGDHNGYRQYENDYNKQHQMSSSSPIQHAVEYNNRVDVPGQDPGAPVFAIDIKDPPEGLSKSQLAYQRQTCFVKSNVDRGLFSYVEPQDNQQSVSTYICNESKYEQVIGVNYMVTNQLCEMSSNEPIADSHQVNSQQSATKSRSPKGRRGRPRKKGQRSKNNVSGKLWEFIRDLLLSDLTNPNFIRWERREDGVFKFVQSDKVAKMWGERKQNPKMTYEKLSRAMRYYYKTKVLLPVFGRRLVYKFGPNATGWKVNPIDGI